ncbi:amidase family protein [Labrenzia sp. R4_2]|uniref:amidase family protein n=1 Tax=Labrenzia sp. R4_2 TaxID=2821107 RepID=UPI001ADAFAEA|nr:amidase family protein [Labrenzia sp. R4_2]MBO9420879.1 amidase family protein [Labrenzia sp. R4_2]
MAEKPVWQLSASELVAAIINGQVTAEAATAATVDRMRTVNGHLNAVVDDMGDEALERARVLDAHMENSGPVGPLHGVPVTIKVNVDQKDKATTNGVKAFSKVIAPDDAPFVKNLTNAGAIVIGRTNTPEFSFRATTTNDLYGRTFSPWNDWASSGGSSGGASTAVMSGMGPIAHGNDIGGSLRFPSAATGAVTVKPGLGRTPAWNPSQSAERGLLAQLMSVQGVICREVRDVRLAMKSAIAYDPHDPWQVPVPFEGPALDQPIRIGFTKNTYQFEAHPAVKKALDAARDCLVDAGYEVVEIETPDIGEIGETGYRALMGEINVLMLNDIRTHGSAEINRMFDEYFELFPPFEGEELLRQMAQRSHFIRQWNLLLEDYPLVLTPFLPSPTYAWNRDAEGKDGIMEVLGCGIWSFAMNYMGLPAGIVSPSMHDGLPVAVQMVGRRFREDMILDALEAIETRTGIMAHKLFDREQAEPDLIA